MARDVNTKVFYANVEYWDKMKAEYPDIQVKIFSHQRSSQLLKKATNELLDEESAKDHYLKRSSSLKELSSKKQENGLKISDYAYIKTNEEKITTAGSSPCFLL